MIHFKKIDHRKKISNPSSYKILEEQIKIKPTIIYFQNIFLLNHDFLEIKKNHDLIKKYFENK